MTGRLERMSRALLALAVAILLVTRAALAFAVEQHVAPTGNDGAAGTLAAPFRTLRHALDRAGPGDTVYLHAGTYAESMSTLDGAIRGGTSWTNALVIAAIPGDTVVLRPNSGSHRVLLLADNRASYVIVRGLVLDARNVRYEGVKVTWSSPGPSNGSHHIRIEDSEVVNAPRHGLLIGANHIELVRLRVHQNGTSDFDHGIYITGADNLVDGCDVFQNAGWGVHVYNGAARGADRNLVRGNRLHDNARVGARGAGVILASGDDNRAINNVVFGNAVGIHVDYAAVRARVYNNTVLAQTADGIHIGAGARDTDVRNNVVFGSFPNFGNVGVRTTTGTNLIGNVNPGFVDAASFDVHLRESSAAIDAGATLDGVAFDHDLVPRPQGARNDMGAFEYRVAPPTLLQPTPE